MGSRGPTRDPESRRGQRERRKAAAGIDDPQACESVVISFPEDLETVEDIFEDLTKQLLAAKVPLRQVDAYAIELAARCTKDIRALDAMVERDDLEPETMLKAIAARGRLSRDHMSYLEKICATPGSRIRIVKPSPKKPDNPALNALNDLLTP